MGQKQGLSWVRCVGHLEREETPAVVETRSANVVTLAAPLRAAPPKQPTSQNERREKERRGEKQGEVMTFGSRGGRWSDPIRSSYPFPSLAFFQFPFFLPAAARYPSAYPTLLKMHFLLFSTLDSRGNDRANPRECGRSGGQAKWTRRTGAEERA